MSGGVAYVYDPHDQFLVNCNLEMVDLENVEDPADVEELRTLFSNHQNYTGSDVARVILSDWDVNLAKFVKVMPVDYKRALLEMADEEAVAST
jgi:glutamate synthase (NADPH/NADH) large chain